jgi:hypothetical protein
MSVQTAATALAGATMAMVETASGELFIDTGSEWKHDRHR